MTKTYREGDFIISVYQDWDMTDVGKYCKECLQALNESPDKVHIISATFTDPIDMEAVDYIRVFRREIELIYTHPKLLSPIALVLTPTLMSMAKQILRMSWLKNYKFLLASSIEEAKQKLTEAKNT